MEYVKRALLAATLAAALLMAPSVSYALLIEGELTEDDFFAQDSFGGFYYDFYEIVSEGTDPITITLDSEDFVAYLAWGVDIDLPPWPTGSDVPYNFSWAWLSVCSTGSASLTFDSPSAGQSFQVLVATYDYVPDTARHVHVDD